MMITMDDYERAATAAAARPTKGYDDDDEVDGPLVLLLLLLPPYRRHFRFPRCQSSPFRTPATSAAAAVVVAR